MITWVTSSVGIVSRDRLPSLTGLRFWAALLVVAYHLTSVVGPLPLLSPLVQFGRSGVTFFFVLSGFVLAWTYLDRPVPFRVFVWRRFARLWPLVIVTGVLSLAVYRVVGQPIGGWQAFTTFVFAQAWRPEWVRGANGAAWSLSDEAFFYAIFPALLLVAAVRWRRQVLVVASLTLIPVIWLVLSQADTARFWLDYFPPTRAVQFVLGVAAGVSMRRGARAPLGYPLTLGLTVAFHVGLIGWARVVNPLHAFGAYSGSQWWSAPLFALLIMASAQRDLEKRFTGVTGPWMLRLGHWSYAWYLIHEVVIRAWRHLAGQPSSTGMTVAVWILLLGLTLLSARALYTWVERPAERWLRTAVFPYRSAETPAPTGGSAIP